LVLREDGSASSISVGKNAAKNAAEDLHDITTELL
jgi:hypothetical protein